MLKYRVLNEVQGVNFPRIGVAKVAFLSTASVEKARLQVLPSPVHVRSVCTRCVLKLDLSRPNLFTLGFSTMNEEY